MEAVCLRLGNTSVYWNIAAGGWDYYQTFDGSYFTSDEMFRILSDNFNTVSAMPDMPVRAHTFGIIRDEDNPNRALVFFSDVYNPYSKLWVFELNNAGVGTWTIVTTTTPQETLLGGRILYGMTWDNGGWILAGGQVNTVLSSGVFTDVLKITLAGNSTSGYTVTITQVATGVTRLGKNISGTMTNDGTSIYQAMGGNYDTTPTYTPQYNISLTGAIWAAQSDILIPGVQYARCVWFSGKLFIITGNNSGGNTYPVYWIDTNGSINQVPLPPGWPNTHACGGTVGKKSDGTDVLIITCGNLFDFIAVIEKIN